MQADDHATFGHAWSRFEGDAGENDHDCEVRNGDMGIVQALDAEEEQMTVDFDGREVTHPPGDLHELVLCCATTIHKSQGSKYAAVMMPLSMQHYLTLERRLVYTGLTRGKRLAGGARRAKARAGHGDQGSKAARRWSKLKERLSG